MKKGMLQTCRADKVEEALTRLQNAPEAVQERARELYCPAYKMARWKNFLVDVLTWDVARGLLPAGETNDLAMPSAGARCALKLLKTSRTKNNPTPPQLNS